MINNPEIPDFLYKYRSFDENGYYKTFIEGKLFFSSPKNFNDPLDTKIENNYSLGTNAEIKEFVVKSCMNIGNLNYKNALKKYESSVATMGLDGLKKIINLNDSLSFFINNEIGICSLSETILNMPMWVHYTDNHKGFCVEYSAKSLNDFISNLYKVRIDHTPIIMNKLIYMDELPVINPYWDSPNEIVEKQFFNKNSDWSYEKEWRLINPHGANAVLSLPHGIITGIYFGLHTTEKKINEVKETVLNSIGKVNFYKAKLGKSNIEFDELY